MTCSAPTSLNGTLADVAAFFRVSTRTLNRWNTEQPPRIAHYRDGALVMYRGDDVARYYAQNYVSDRRLSPVQALEVAREAWREHLQLRTADGLFDKVHELERRLEHVEALGALVRKEAA